MKEFVCTKRNRKVFTSDHLERKKDKKGKGYKQKKVQEKSLPEPKGQKLKIKRTNDFNVSQKSPEKKILNQMK